jgi:hypothetical protein
VNGRNKTDPVFWREVEIHAQIWIPIGASVHTRASVERFFHFQAQITITLITIFVNAGGLFKSPFPTNLQLIETPH